LIIDDEDYIRDLVKDFLHLKEIPCDGAEDSDSSLRLIRENPYDLILLDKNLATETAEDVVLKIRQVAADTPIILLTGDQGMTDEYAREAGMNAVVHKPFRLEDFFEAIGRFLEPA